MNYSETFQMGRGLVRMIAQHKDAVNGQERRSEDSEQERKTERMKKGGDISLSYIFCLLQKIQGEIHSPHHRNSQTSHLAVERCSMWAMVSLRFKHASIQHAMWDRSIKYFH